MARAFAVHLPPQFVPSTLSLCSRQRQVAQGGSEHPKRLRSCAWVLVPGGSKPTPTAQGWGAAPGAGRSPAFAGSLGFCWWVKRDCFKVAWCFRKQVICFHPDSQRWRWQSQEENLCPGSARGTSAARGFFLCWLTLTFSCTWPFCCCFLGV